MLRVSSVVFCALLSIPVLKQKLGWHKWIGIMIIIAGITLKSVPSIQDFLTGEAEEDGCVGMQELSKSAMMVNLTATETDAALSQACDKTCQTLIGILLIIISEVIIWTTLLYHTLLIPNFILRLLVRVKMFMKKNTSVNMICIP